MPERVIKLGELVDVDHQHGQSIAAELMIANRFVETRFEQAAVRQLGQLVVQRNAARTLLDFAALVELGDQSLVRPRELIVRRAHALLEIVARLCKRRFHFLACADVIDQPHGFAGRTARRDAS